MFIKDKEFIRGNCPMTKEEVRILSVAKMNINDDSIVLDIGSGTGSITVQAAKISIHGKVIAIEKEDDAYEVTTSNISKFKCTNIEVIKEDAVKALEALISKGIKFNSIFIGGSGGSLEEIIRKSAIVLASDGTIVMNFITLDNAYKAIEFIKSLGYKHEVSLVNISKNRENTLMMIANNPIYIIQCTI